MGVRGAAVVVRDDDGKFVTKDQIGDETESALADVSTAIRSASTGLLADVSEESSVAIDAVIAKLGGTVPGRSTGDVQAEKINAKLADRRAELDRHAEPAATS